MLWCYTRCSVKNTMFFTPLESAHIWTHFSQLLRKLFCCSFHLYSSFNLNNIRGAFNNYLCWSDETLKKNPKNSEKKFYRTVKSIFRYICQVNQGICYNVRPVFLFRDGRTMGPFSGRTTKFLRRVQLPTRSACPLGGLLMPETDNSHRGQGPGSAEYVYNRLEPLVVKNFIMARISQSDSFVIR